MWGWGRGNVLGNVLGIKSTSGSGAFECDFRKDSLIQIMASQLNQDF